MDHEDSAEKPVQIEIHVRLAVHVAVDNLDGIRGDDGILEVIVGECEIGEDTLPILFQPVVACERDAVHLLPAALRIGPATVRAVCGLLDLVHGVHGPALGDIVVVFELIEVILITAVSTVRRRRGGLAIKPQVTVSEV